MNPWANILCNLLISSTLSAFSIAVLTLSFSSLLSNLPALPEPEFVVVVSACSTPGSKVFEEREGATRPVWIWEMNCWWSGVGSEEEVWNNEFACSRSYTRTRELAIKNRWEEKNEKRDFVYFLFNPLEI